MKNFKKQLKKEASTDTPDLYDGIMDKAEELGLFDGESVPPVSVGGGAVAARSSIKPVIFTACAFLLAAAITLGIVLPLTLKKAEFPVFNPVELSVNDFYGAGALSSVKLLSDGNKTAKSRAKTEVGDVKEQIDYFNKYLSAFDAFLGDEFIKTTSGANTNEQYAQYEKCITVSAKDLDGNANSYVMYYNETLEKDDGEERNYILKGVMVFDGSEYLLRGERSEENEDDEREEELKIRAYTAANPENYVEMKQEVSEENNERETEYVYRVYTNNKLVEETSVEFETEVKNGKTETEYELEFRKGEAKGKYKVEREVENGVVEISVKYNLDGNSGKFKVREIKKGGELYYEYVFADNSTELIKK